MRRRRPLAGVVGTLALLAASLVYAAWPGGSRFTIDTETTYVTGPLDKQGYVDHVTALNERLSKGISADKNANVLIWQALGPRPEGGSGMPSEYFQWLGIEPPPEEGEYLISWQTYLKEHPKVGSGTEDDPPNDRIFRAAQWPWRDKDEPEIADWLKENERPLALVMEATRRPEYYNPLVPPRTEDWSPGLPGALLPNVQRCREVAAALACRAMLRVTEAKFDDAWQDLLACHRLGRLVARGGTQIEMLVGVAIDQFFNQADLAFLQHANLTSKQALACLEDLRKLSPLPSVADKVDLAERFMLLDMIMLTARQGTRFLESPPGSSRGPPQGDQFRARLFTRSINWDPAFRNANRWVDRYVAGLRIRDRTARMEEIAAITRDLENLKQQIDDLGFIEKLFLGSERRGEMIGNVLVVLMLPAFDKIQNAADRREQVEHNLHVAFSLAAYKHDYGCYPAKLDELAPKYLVKIPDDLFSGEPLNYRLEEKGYLLYSVGPNGVDDQGRGPEDEPRGDDLSVRMPVPEPRSKE